MSNLAVIPPADTEEYYRRMGSSLEEKLFFLDRIPQDVAVFGDYGCGPEKTILRATVLRRGGCILAALGYEPFAETSDRFPYSIHKTWSTWAERFTTWGRRGKSCLILSSVVHEVLSQGHTFKDWWSKEIAPLKADYIVIRDMACDHEAKAQPAPEWATEKTRADWLQAMLKYRYTDDIQKEQAEDYFALTAQQWHNYCTIGTGYELVYFDHHSLPYWREQWKKDFDLDIPDPTHIKIILKRKA